MEEITAAPVIPVEQSPETLTVEELQGILRAKARAVQLTGMAEKALADARIAELEAQNIILLTYNKYNLNQSIGDSISENGVINRAKNNGDNNGDNNGQ